MARCPAARRHRPDRNRLLAFALLGIASPQWRAFRENPSLQKELMGLRAKEQKALPPLLR